MDLSGSQTYNGFTFTEPTLTAGRATASGAQIDKISFGGVVGASYLDKRALDDGLDAVDVFLGGRNVNILSTVYGDSAGEAFDTLDDLIEAFNPVVAYNADTANRGFLAFDFDRPTIDTSTWTAGSIPQRMLLRPTASPSYSIERRKTSGSVGFAIPVTIPLVARDPRIYLQTQQSISLSTSSQTATHRGNFQSWPFVTITLSGTGSSNVNIIMDGHTVGLNLSTESTGVFSINYANRHVTNSSGDSRDDLLRSTWDQDWTPVQAGGSVVRMSNVTNLTATFAWREAWL